MHIMSMVPLLRFELRELLLLREMTLPICLQGAGADIQIRTGTSSLEDSHANR